MNSNNCFLLSSFGFLKSARIGVHWCQLVVSLAVSAAVFPALSGVSHAAERKPNFLFVYTDDQRWDAMGVVQREQGERARFPWFQTPNMDRVAAEGVRFRNAFVTLSLCAPSRAAFLTGRYNHSNGVINNHTPFPETSVTHATLLGAAGYKTAYIGKWHMGGQRGKRPGFDYSASFIGQGRYIDCPIEVNGTSTPSTGWVDDVLTDYAIDYIKQNKDKPFSVVVGYKACHGPTSPPERAKDRFAGEKARSVPNMGVRAVYRTGDEAPRGKKKAAADSADGVNINLNYFRCISAADDNLGKLLKVLDDLGLADNTVVVFASDNGYYNGEHNLGDKRSAYDESLRIPMIVRCPKLFPKGKVRDEMVLNIDLAPTYLELAGVAVPPEMHGRSWVPLLTDKKTEWRRSFLGEYFYEQNFVGTPTLVALRTTDAKLIKYPGHEDWTELFDLVKDPYEIKNLAADSAHKDMLARMNAEFERQVKATDYKVPADADKEGSVSEGAKKKGKKAASE
jgi:arylsulfatase A-like enzyme